MNTIADSLKVAVGTLEGSSESPRLDAELILCKVTGLSRSALIIRADEVLAADNQTLYQRLIARRVDGAPVAYLTGTREFWTLRLSVTPDVLVPRPDTELLVAEALALIPEDQPRAILDLGTGSGAIALAIASERPHARVTAVDVSPNALAVARKNAVDLQLGHVDWRLGSWFDPLAAECFDIIVANPPYIAAADPALGALGAEPLLALTPGNTGLEALSIIIASAPAHLHAGGWLLLEHGSTQGDAVARLLERHGFSGVHTLVDYADKPRVTLGVAPSLHHSSHHTSH